MLNLIKGEYYLRKKYWRTFKIFENKWKFDQKENFTEVTFDLDFELKNKFLNIFMNKSFKYGLDKIADAFQNRAEKLFNKV